MRFGLAPVTAALEQLGRPDQVPKARVLIAGTNGKGSTSLMVESIGRTAGLKTGVFTSPHLNRFTERFRIDGQEVGQNLLLHVARDITPLGLTFFESATLIAAKLFAHCNVDLAIYEVGLGGRLDATNALNCQVAAVTSIGFDHQELLGDSLAEIAGEKAAIFHNRPYRVLGPHFSPEALNVLTKLAHWRAGVVLRAAPYEGPLNSMAPYQRDNAGTAQAIIKALTALLPRLHVHRFTELGLSNVQIPGRFETISEKPRLLVDCAHNPEGAQALAKQVLQLPGPRIAVIAMSSGKDYPAMAEILQGSFHQCVLTQANHPRAASARLVARHFSKQAKVLPNLPDALQWAVAKAGTGGSVVVCGSLFAVGQTRRLVLGELADPRTVTDRYALDRAGQ